MDQMDLSNLENLLTSFDNFSKAGIEKDGQKNKSYLSMGKRCCAA